MTRPLGTPTWIDLGSNDFASTKAFYEGLFGWRFDDAGEEYGHYCMVYNGDALVGGAMDTSGMTGPDGAPLPSRWDVYLAASDIDQRVELAKQHGAQVLMEPHDAGAAGRFSMLLDPSGAVVGLWAAGDTEGFAFEGKPGGPVWFELMTPKFDAAEEFYTAVFDFDFVSETMSMEGSDFRYATNGPEQEASSGIFDTSVFPDGGDAYWRAYIAIESTDAALAKVKELGGTVLDGPDDSPFGRITTIADPQGAQLQLCAMSESTPDE